jgi:hypothetical protein
MSVRVSLTTSGRLHLAALLSGVILIAWATCCHATETTVKNDSLVTASSGTPLTTLAQNEMAAVWLTTPAAGYVVGVQVLWSSLAGGSPASLEWALHVFDGGVTFPTPGSPLATIPGPTLTDGAVNEFRFLDTPADTMPLQVPVAAKQTFVVALEILNSGPGLGNPFFPGVVFDGDGFQASTNAAFAIPGGWIDANLAGVTGDFGIRAILSSVLPGDFDVDGDVDGFDFLKWQVGMSPNPFSQSDLAAWEANYGMVAPLAAASAAVPEPNSLLLSLIGLLALSRLRRATTIIA